MKTARAGVVLAGGFGTRFEEGEKLLARYRGRPLLAHALEGIAPAVDAVVMSCREEQIPAFRDVFSRVEVPVAPAPDPVADRGPAAGVATALETVEAPLVAVVAGDMPFVDADFLDELFDRLETSETNAVVPEIDGHSQPTHAVYRTDALHEAATTALETGDASLVAVLDRLSVTTLPEERVLSLTTPRSFFDVNTVDELRTAAEEFED